jgi:hypothetical protein
MAKVLIVAKTHMATGACIGGFDCDASKNIRLIPSGRLHHTADTPFDVGQTWEIEYTPSPEITPPHVEDVIVTKEQYLSRVADVGSMLRERVKPWQGAPTQLFDGLLSFRNGRGYISRSRGISSSSVGFWIADKPLKRVHDRNKVYYSYGQSAQGAYLLPYVGYAETVAYIPAGALMRVSLARWWTPEGMHEPRCYLQLSGWYL